MRVRASPSLPHATTKNIQTRQSMSPRPNEAPSDRPDALLRNSRRAVVEWLAWTAIAGVAVLQTGNFNREIADYAFGADGWPLAICSAIFLGATLQLAFRLRQVRRFASPPTDHADDAAAGALSADPTGGNSGASRPTAQFIAIFLLPFVYLFLVPRLGFYLMTPFFILALLFLMQVRSLMALALVTASAYGIALLIFTRFFYVALPVGRIEPFYGMNNAIIALVRTGL